MNKFILIPDSFKGTMSSSDICAIMAEQIAAVYPGAQAVSLPVADGGEGTVDSFLEAVGGEKRTLTVTGPLGESMEGFYGILGDGKTAVVEMAAAAGLPLVQGRENPLLATTFGVGELILDAAKSGVERIVVGLGGSSTNDGGCGAAAAVGVRFLNGAGEAFVPAGGTLKDIANIDISGLHPAVRDVRITAMCDIDNPMYGPSGAAHIFGPQKGASPAVVEELDAGIRHLAEVIRRSLGQNLDDVPGTGAAGAMGAGMVAFFGASLQMGIETILDVVQFDKLATDADIVLTGEGKIDGQSLRGKVVVGVARRASKLGVPVVAVVGDIGDNISEIYGQGVSGIFSINRVAVGMDSARTRSRSDMALTVENLMRFLRSMGL
ncbi:MAG: glycerate kinase [Oscillospiraceae bacterium]